ARLGGLSRRGQAGSAWSCGGGHHGNLVKMSIAYRGECLPIGGPLGTPSLRILLSILAFLWAPEAWFSPLRLQSPQLSPAEVELPIRGPRIGLHRQFFAEPAGEIGLRR